jgi:N-dimethylarginine dimethylaminohydrolase
MQIDNEHKNYDYQRTVLMGDPSHFSVQGGANPHTRTRWGTRRKVDRELAIEQWKGLKRALEELDVRVIVVPPDPEQPGLVYPANAGCQSDVDHPDGNKAKVFTLSNLLPTRAGEKEHYRRVLEAEGFLISEIDEQYRFEGEADFFPAGDVYLFTHGTLEIQRFVPTLGIPPWKRVYGFRTDVRVESLLAPKIAPMPIIKVGLVLEAHYHGDTALCAFGLGRRELLVYRDAIDVDDMKQLEKHFEDHILELSKEDAQYYAANSFTYERDGDCFLIMPEGVSERLMDQVRDRNVTPITVNVSEFLKKGGGSVKCMIGDLGLIAKGRVVRASAVLGG